MPEGGAWRPFDEPAAIDQLTVTSYMFTTPAELTMRRPFHMLRCALVSFFVAVGLTACATRGVIQDGSTLDPGKGLLIFKATSNIEANLNFVTFEPEVTTASKLKEYWAGAAGTISLEKGEKYIVLPVASGEYMWSQISSYPWKADLRSSNKFQVRQGAITYIGSIRILTNTDYPFSTPNYRVGLAAIDEEAEVKTYLTQNFPRFSRSMPFEKAIAKFKM